MKLRLNKNIVIVIFLLFVFAVGTIGFVDTVEAAKWKKLDSGSFNVEKPDAGYKKKISYTSYTKGANNIKMDLFGYKKKNNKKIKLQTIFYTKSGDKVKYYNVNSKGKKSKVQSATINTTLKTFYKNSTTALKSKNTTAISKNGTIASKLQYKYVYDYGYYYGYRYELDLVYAYDYLYGYYRYRYEYVWKWGYKWEYQWVWKWV